MIGSVVKKLFGTKSDRDIRQLVPLVEEINAVDNKVSAMSTEQLRAKTDEFRQRLDQGETLDDILPEAFDVVRETAKRIIGERPFDVQLMGAIVIHQGKIAEMATGEGKTLVATMPAYLNALAGKGVHIVTVNDYLARRDASWMGPIYEALGLTVGSIQSEMGEEERQQAYNSDITYGTNNEFGFDYLRDNMKHDPALKVQRGHHYAILDEIDNILVDEARTPLIISGPVERDNQQFEGQRDRVERLYRRQLDQARDLTNKAKRHLDEEKTEEAGIALLKVRMAIPKYAGFRRLMEDADTQRLVSQTEMNVLRDKQMNELVEELYFTVDEKSRSATLTEKGRDYLSPSDSEEYVVPEIAEKLHEIDESTELHSEEKQKQRMELYQEFDQKTERVHTVDQLIKALTLFEVDVDYVIQDNNVVLVDEFTGRLMPNRRLSDGLHQAIEAKERVKVGAENQTVATITFQNYFRMYEKLAGMTGTADTEAEEFQNIYKLDVVVVPTNMPMVRGDNPDSIFKTEREKFDAIVEEIAELDKKKQPVLVGTVSIEKSERLSKKLQRKRIPHQVLNAKHHEKEAEIIALAGQPGAVTIATNMAGRGTDIKLGPGVVEMGGLHIIGSERHESRRIDNQLRGRAGRQGDPGSSRFYLSLEDDLMRLFGSDRVQKLMEKMGMEDGEVIEHKWVTKAIATAQKRVEMRNFDVRKRLLEYDDVMNKQRGSMYRWRDQILRSEEEIASLAELKSQFFEIVDGLIEEEVAAFCSENTGPEDWNLVPLQDWSLRHLGVQFDSAQFQNPEQTSEDVKALLRTETERRFDDKVARIGEENIRRLYRDVFLYAIDSKWREYLYSLDSLKESVHLRAYSQRDPIIEYKKESSEMFYELVHSIETDAVSLLMRVEIRDEPQRPTLAAARRRRPLAAASARHASTQSFDRDEPTERASQSGAPQPRRIAQKVGRNAPCPCGSGKKYKKCCGA